MFYQFMGRLELRNTGLDAWTEEGDSLASKWMTGNRMTGLMTCRADPAGREWPFTSSPPTWVPLWLSPTPRHKGLGSPHRSSTTLSSCVGSGPWQEIWSPLVRAVWCCFTRPRNWWSWLWFSHGNCLPRFLQYFASLRFPSERRPQQDAGPDLQQAAEESIFCCKWSLWKKEVMIQPSSSALGHFVCCCQSFFSCPALLMKVRLAGEKALTQWQAEVKKLICSLFSSLILYVL